MRKSNLISVVFGIFCFFSGCTEKTKSVSHSEKNIVDSINVYTVSKNSDCIDCANYCEVFLSIFNPKHDKIIIPFYSNSRGTNFYLDWNGQRYNLQGNDGENITILPNKSHSFLLMVNELYVPVKDSGEYIKLVNSIIKNGKFKYFPHENDSVVFEIPQDIKIKIYRR